MQKELLGSPAAKLLRIAAFWGLGKLILSTDRAWKLSR